MTQQRGNGSGGPAWLPTVSVVLMCLVAIPPVTADRERPDYDPALLASDAELDATRGGFALDNGMVINISIDKRVYQNGVETFASYFESPQDMALLQAGSRDIGTQFADNLLTSIVQNTMDNQLIETISRINIELRNPAAMTQDVTGAGIFSQFLQPTFQ